MRSNWTTRPGLAAMLFFASPSPIVGQSLTVPCVAENAAARVDHVVIAVKDMTRSTATFSGLGFSFKDGRIHDNGQRNRHIKLASDEDLELMAIEGQATDGIAEAYLRFLQDGEGGAFLALSAPPAKVEVAARAVGLESLLTKDQGFSYVTFPTEPGLAAVFFIEYATRPPDPPSVLEHANGAADLTSVHIEDDGTLERLLIALGGRVCPSATSATDVVVAIQGSRVVLAPSGGTRPRVMGVELTGAGVDGDRRVSADEAHGISLYFTGGGKR